MTTIYVTRYALTQGIQKIEASIRPSNDVAAYKVPGYWMTQYVHRKDFYLTEDAAKVRANEMLARKIASTEKSLERLKKLTF